MDSSLFQKQKHNSPKKSCLPQTTLTVIYVAYALNNYNIYRKPQILQKWEQNDFFSILFFTKILLFFTKILLSHRPPLLFDYSLTAYYSLSYTPS